MKEMEYALTQPDSFLNYILTHLNSEETGKILKIRNDEYIKIIEGWRKTCNTHPLTDKSFSENCFIAENIFQSGKTVGEVKEIISEYLHSGKRST